VGFDPAISCAAVWQVTSRSLRQCYSTRVKATEQMQTDTTAVFVSGPEVLFETCVAMKFVDDDDDDDDLSDFHWGVRVSTGYD